MCSRHYIIGFGESDGFLIQGDQHLLCIRNHGDTSNVGRGFVVFT